MNKYSFAGRLTLAIMSGSAALITYASANHHQWRLLCDCREYLIASRSTRTITSYFCDRCADFISQAVSISSETTNAVDARLVHIMPGIVCDVHSGLSLDELSRTIATIVLIGLSLDGGFRFSRATAKSLGFGTDPERCSGFAALTWRGVLVRAFSTVVLSATSGLLAWYLTFERIPSTTGRPLHANFIPGWWGVAVLLMLNFLSALSAGMASEIVRCRDAALNGDLQSRKECLNCGYPLANAPASVCSECGVPADIRRVRLLLSKIRHNIALRTVVVFTAILICTCTIMFAVLDDTERRELSTRIKRWVAVKGVMSGAVAKGQGWPFIPLRADRPVSVTTDGTEVLLWFVYLEQDRIRYVVATRPTRSQNEQPSEDISVYTICSGEYPRKGPLFEVLVDAPDLLLVSDWSQAFLGPYGTFNPVHVRRGRVECVQPFDATLNSSLLSELRLILDAPS